MIRYNSNVDKIIPAFAKSIQGLEKDVQLRATIEVAQWLEVSNIERIHEEGKDVHEVKIANYSTKATFIGASSFVNKGGANKVLGTKNKRKQLDWRTVKGRRLAILKGGYKQIRNLDNLPSNTVDLKRTGALMNSLGIIAKRGKYIALGFTNNYGAKLRGYQETKYRRKIWGISKKRDLPVIKKILAKFVKQNIQ